MNGRIRGLIRPVQRLARLLAARNQLRRPADRIEGALLLALSAAFLATIAGAAVLGAHLYQSQRASTAELRQVWAIAVRPRPGRHRFAAVTAGELYFSSSR